MFNKCDFLLGDNNSIVIIVPEFLPKDQKLTVEVENSSLCFKSGEDTVASIAYVSREILGRLMGKAKVGIVEFMKGTGKFPAYISVVADVKINSGLMAA